MGIPSGATSGLKALWQRGFFEIERDSAGISAELSQEFKINLISAELSTALNRAKYLKRSGKRGSYRFVQRYSFKADKKKASRNVVRRPEYITVFESMTLHPEIKQVSSKLIQDCRRAV